MATIPKPIQDYISGVMPNMQGWCSEAKATALVEHVLSLRPDVCVEIGVFAGRSLIAIALALHVSNSGRIIGIDPWLSEESVKGWETDKDNFDWWNAVNHTEIFKECKEYVQHMGVHDRVSLLKCTSEFAYHVMRLPVDLTGHPYIDFLHIDGNHSQESALFDVLNYVPLVERGGVICFDDVNWQSTAAAQQKLAETCDEIQRVESEGQMCAFFRKR